MRKNIEKHNRVRKRFIFISGTLVLAAVVILLRVFFYDEPLKLSPMEKYFDRLHGFTDNSDHGESEITDLSFDANRIVF